MSIKKTILGLALLIAGVAATGSALAHHGWHGRFGISIGHKDTDNLLRYNEVRAYQQDGVFFRNESEGMAGHRNRLENNVIENNSDKTFMGSVALTPNDLASVEACFRPERFPHAFFAFWEGESWPADADVIVKVDGQPVPTIERLIDVIASKQPGDQIDLEVVRETKRINVTVKLGRQP